MYITKFNHEDATPLNELFRFSSQVADRLSRSPRFRKLDRTNTQVKTESSRLVNHATPLSSLTERDLEALAAMFEPEDATEVEAELAHYLNLMCPEPCWEEDPFDFLRDYL